MSVYSDLIDSYFERNNSIGLMDSLQINSQIIKSGKGYNTDTEPVVGDHVNMVNREGSILSVTGKVLGIKSDRGFDFNQTGNISLDGNSPKPLMVGRVYYEPYYNNSSLPSLCQSAVDYSSKFNN